MATEREGTRQARINITVDKSWERPTKIHGWPMEASAERERESRTDSREAPTSPHESPIPQEPRRSSQSRYPPRALKQSQNSKARVGYPRKGSMLPIWCSPRTQVFKSLSAGVHRVSNGTKAQNKLLQEPDRIISRLADRPQGLGPRDRMPASYMAIP
jgi:hypothetical protein